MVHVASPERSSQRPQRYPHTHEQKTKLENMPSGTILTASINAFRSSSGAHIYVDEKKAISIGAQHFEIGT